MCCKKVGLKDIKPSNISLVFGDSSEKTPEGIIHNLQVMVGNYIVPMDFHVIDTGDIDRPLILGRAFLAIVGAVIDHCNHNVPFVPECPFSCNFLRNTNSKEPLHLI